MENNEGTERKECPSCQRKCHSKAQYCAGCGAKFAGKNVESDGGELRKIVRSAVRDELDERETARREKKKAAVSQAGADESGDFGNWGDD